MNRRMLLVVIALLAALDAGAAESDYLTYEQLIKHVEDGDVSQVTLDRYSHIKGTLTEAGTTREFESYTDTGSVNDPLLMRLLDAHGVSVAVAPIEDSFFWGAGGLFTISFGLFTILLPLVMFILLLMANRKLNRLRRAVAELRRAAP